MSKLKIDPVIFNNCTFSSIEILESARKHYGKKSDEIFQKISKTLNNRQKEPDGVRKSGNPYYIVDSCTSFVIDNKEYNYRDTCFYLNEQENSIIFFHGCQRKEKEYKKFSEKLKKGYY